MYYAHSAIADEEDSRGYKGTGKLVLLKETRRFKLDVPKMDGTIRKETYNDTEAKLFEFLLICMKQTPLKRYACFPNVECAIVAKG